MTMKISFFFLFAIILIVTNNGGLSVLAQRMPLHRAEDYCRFERLQAVEPDRRVESEGGAIEFWDQSHHHQLQCAGVAVHRIFMDSNTLLLPEFSNAPRLVYILQGSGVSSAVIPGCPETYQYYREASEGSTMIAEEEEGSAIRGDEHQKVFRFRRGDVIAYPAGVSHWCYNDGDSPVQAIVVHHTASDFNQLGPNVRSFKLAGSEKGGRQGGGKRQSEEEGDNIFSGFDEELLAEILGANREVVRKLQNPEQNRGRIVRVESGELSFLHASRRSKEEEEVHRRRESYEEEEESETESGRRRRRRRRSQPMVNGIEEAICHSRLHENIDDPQRADVYNPRGGRLTTLNSNKLPVLSFIQMSAVRGNLYRGSHHAPHWNLNAHSVVVATGGRGRLEIVDNRGRSVFDGEIRRGQLVVVPQGYVVVKHASDEEAFEWVSFKTSDRAITSPVVGKTSVLRGIPRDVLANAFQISRRDARRIKFSRGEELDIFAPRSTHHGGRFSQ